MKKVLVFENQLHDIVDQGNTFPVAPAMFWVDAPDDVGISTHEFNGTSVVRKQPAPPPIPQSVTMRQARLALLGAGLLAGVDAAINSLSEPNKSAAQIEWEYAAVVQRESGLVPAMGTALGMTEAQLDALFVEAATL